jgi:hypothetical protein
LLEGEEVNINIKHANISPPWFGGVHLMLIIFTVAFKNAKYNICMTPHPQHPIGL